MITVVYVGKEILAFNCRESFLFVSVVLGNFQINTQFSEVTLFLTHIWGDLAFFFIELLVQGSYIPFFVFSA